MSEQFPQPENKREQPSITEGVDFIFEQHPELAEIGTKEQYSQYIETIFPDTKFKEIVYHNSNNDFKEEGFKATEPKFDTLNSIKGVYNFSSNRKFVERYGKNCYAVVLDVRNPLESNNSGEYVDDMDRPLSEALFEIGIQKESNAFAPVYNEDLKDTDAFINHISGEEYVENHPVSGRELGIPRQTLISVFDNSKISILGTPSDVKSFKEFVG
jgi:hypothetical protein